MDKKINLFNLYKQPIKKYLSERGSNKNISTSNDSNNQTNYNNNSINIKYKTSRDSKSCFQRKEKFNELLVIFISFKFQ